MTALLNILKYVPASVGIKALEKFNPKFKNYFSMAAAYGLDLNRAFDFIKENIENPSNEAFKQGIEQRIASGRARPDEMQAMEQERAAELPGKALRAGLSYGAGTALARREAKQAMPSMLTEEAETALPESATPARGVTQPADQSTMEQSPGLSMPQASRQQVGQTLSPMQLMTMQQKKSGGMAQAAPKQLDPLEEIAKHSKPLANHIERNLQKGTTPIEAVAVTLLPGHKLEKEAKKVQKKVGKSLIDYIEELFGYQQPQQQALFPPETQFRTGRPGGQQMQGQPQAMGSSPGKQQFLQLQQQMLQALQGMRQQRG